MSRGAVRAIVAAMLRGRAAIWGLAAIGSIALAAPACDGGSQVAPPSNDPGSLPARSRLVPVEKAVDVVRVAWPREVDVDRDVAAKLSPEARRAVGASHVPVLVPRQTGLVDRAILVVRDNFYAAAITGGDAFEGVTVNVSATRVAHRYRGTPIVHGPDRVRGAREAFVTQNEGIWSATWNENGVGYVVEVECAHPSDDARCADATFVKGIADELAFVGGSFSDGGAR
ncbi:MAG TPA: hypothetical protein VL400_19845 [Polyangiaceae bacterium]|nr:hypothetical protein [Polyangiaceae bacterium]